MRKIILLLLLSLTLSACSANRANPPESAKTEFTDAIGQIIAVDDCENVVVCSGSFAQIWTLAGGTVLATTADAFDDGYIKHGEAENVGSAHNPGLELVIAQNPSLVILFADMEGHVKLLEPLASANIKTAYFSVDDFDDYLDMLKICADMTGRDDLYEQNGLQIKSRIDAIIDKANDKPSPKILLVRAGAGKVVSRGSDTMAGIMLKNMGCVNIADSNSILLEDLSMEIIIQEDPDFIFATYMGDEEKSQKTLRDILQNNPAWSGLSAVKNNRYIVLPKDLFHQKPNNRWAESYEYLWGILYGQ